MTAHKSVIMTAYFKVPTTRTLISPMHYYKAKFPITGPIYTRTCPGMIDAKTIEMLLYY